MTEIDYYGLSRAVQESLLDSLSGRFNPVPILIRRGTRPSVVTWLGASGAALVGLVVLWSSGFGRVESALSYHPLPLIVVYILLIATMVVGVLNALAFRARTAALPFYPGLYLFPANLIDAREHKLRVFPLAELSGLAGRGGSVVLTFGLRRFAFPAGEANRVPLLIEQVAAARDRMKGPLDPEERRKLDPLEPPAVARPLALEVPLTRTPSTWEARRWLLAAAAGLAFGVGIFFLRNVASDKKMYAAVIARDDVASYKSYLLRGHRQRDVVEQVLLPRAELRLAIAQGTVEAIDAFIREHPKTGVEAEVVSARRAALVAEFERARKVGTLTALLSFAERFPNHGIGPIFDQVRHALYARALERYRTMMPEGGKPTAEFAGRLLAYAEKTGSRSEAGVFHGPPVEVRFRRLPSRDMERADEGTRKSPMFNGSTSLPSRYLDTPRLEPHEQETAGAIADRLARAFDPALLTFSAGPAVEGAPDDLPAMTKPTLVVSYRIEPSGAAYASKKPRGIFMGLAFAYSCEFILPGDTQPLRMKTNVVTRIPLDVLKDQSGGPPGTLEAAFYETITHDAFAEFTERYLATWFKKLPSPP